MNYTLLKRCLAFLAVIVLSIAAIAQDGRTITGKVTDSNGDPLPGANIVLKGTTEGVVTDAEGNYRITVDNPDNAVLECSFIGFITEQNNIGGESVLDFSLDEDVTTLDELVVIGYGTVKKRDLTGSVSSIKSSEITKTASNNALQSMQGKIAGLDITKASGESGSELNITLRGNRSVWASNDPLFLVDGVEYGSNLDLNSSDIESIEVLKDASSTAIYGTRGANGVIIITTKRGTAASEKLNVSFNSYVSVNSPTNLPKLMDVQQEYLFLAERQRYSDETTAGNTWGSTRIDEYPANEVLSDLVTAPYEKSLYEIYTEGGVDWFDIILQNGLTQNYELAFSGGNDQTKFNFSLGYMNEEGLLKNDNLKRYNARVNVDHYITKNLKVGTNLLFTYRDWDRREDEIYGQLIKMHSLAQPYLADGTILDKPSELATSHTNPLLNEVPGYYSDNTNSNRLFGNVYLDWEILKGLHFKSVFGIDQQSSRIGEYEDYLCTENYQSGRGSHFSVENLQGMAYTWENTLNYSVNLGGNHDLQLLAGQSAYKNLTEIHKTLGFGSQDHYGVNSFYDLSNILSDRRIIEDSYAESRLLSYFGRANYKLLNRYLLTASLRADGSSVLAEGNKWGYFPSVAAAWVLSEEAFLNSSHFITNLKLRASWGQAGNSAVKPYQTLTELGIDKIYYSFGSPSQLIPGQVPAKLGNPEVTWETTTTYDAGLDISVLKSRISATFDFYYSQTDDLLLFKGLPPTSVYPQVLANVGETENIGFETAFSTRIIEKKNTKWQADLVFSANRDKIVSLASGETRDVSNPDKALVVGEPVNAFYDYEANGCWRIDETDMAAKYNAIPGSIKIIDANSDTVLNNADKRIYNFRADAMLIADMGSVRPGVPTLTIGLRGMGQVSVEVETLAGPKHSGQYGGAAPDALGALLRALASLHDDDGDVVVEGLLREPWTGAAYTEEEFRSLAEVLPDAPLVGTGDLGSRVWSGPAITVTGIDVPSVDEALNAVNARARAKISMRVHPAQDAGEAQAAVMRHLEAALPWGISLTVRPIVTGNGFLADTTGPAYEAARDAMHAAWGVEASYAASGGSIPLVNALHQAVPEAEILLLGTTDGYANIHAPNERVLLEEFEKAVLVETEFLGRFADAFTGQEGTGS